MLKRLTDWWTRPSWDEYLAEHAGCLAVLVELDDLKSEIEHLKSDLNVARDEAEMQKGSYEDAEDDAEAFQNENHVLQAELNRLRKLGIEQVEGTPVHDIKIENGAVEVTSRPPHWAVRSMAASFLETLDGAPNWRAIEIGPVLSDDGWLIVTVCRKSGDSPVETVGKLKAVVEEMLGNEFAVFGNDLIQRARAFLNPEKKDA